MDGLGLHICLLGTLNSMITLNFFFLSVNWSDPRTSSTTNHILYRALGRLHGPWCKQPLELCLTIFIKPHSNCWWAWVETECCSEHAWLIRGQWWHFLICNYCTLAITLVHLLSEIHKDFFSWDGGNRVLCKVSQRRTKPWVWSFFEKTLY